MDSDVSQTKLVASLVLFVLTMLCGYLPVKTILNQRYIQYAIFAGGGVLMATAFCHIIPEAHDNYKLSQVGPLQHSHGALAQPAYLAATQQVASSAVVEPISNSINSTESGQPSESIKLQQQHHHHHHHHHNLTSNKLDPGEQPQESHKQLSDTNRNEAPDHNDIPYVEITICFGFFFIYFTEQLLIRFINTHTHSHPCDPTVIEGRFNVGQLASTGEVHLVSGDLANCNDLNGASVTNQLNSSTTLNTINSESVRVVRSNSTSSTKAGTELYKFIRGFLIVSAFIIHALFDGVAIGSQESVGQVWTVCFAICCHKLIIAAVVGFELFSATLGSHLWTLFHLGLFSIMSPIGIILIVIAQSSLHIEANDPVMVLLQAFAAGTLLYIVFIEILQPKENQANEKNKLGKSVSLIIGFILMTLVLTFSDVD